MKRFLVLTVLGFALAHSGVATAQSNVERAERLYQDALEAFKENDYSRAATFFHASWELVPKPELLYNEAVAWARHGDVTRALEAGIAAAAEELPDGMRVKNSARVAAWSAVTNAKAAVVARPAVVVREVESVPAELKDPGPSSPAGIVVMSTGVAALAAWGLLELLLAGAVNDMRDAAAFGDRAGYDSALSRAEDIQVGARAVAVSGIVLTLAGATIVLMTTPRGDAALQLGPTGLRLVHQ